jgi:uncharacterized delta-60 repeat protein
MGLLLLGLIAVASSAGQAGPGRLDSSFRTQPGTGNSPVFAVSVQRDGKLLLGGYFARVIRLLPDGRVDNTFEDSELGGHLHAILALPDGKIVIGGYFSSVGGSPCNSLARLNPGGSLDTTFNDPRGGPGGESSPHVDALAVQPNGKIIVAGDFTTYDSTPRQGLVRLQPDGQLDPTFDPGQKLLGHKCALLVDPNGKILVGGGFTNCHGAGRYGITRLNADGSLDTAFQPSPGAELYVSVNALVVQPDGRIVVGGGFTWMNGQPRNGLARLNPDGGLDSTFDPGSGVEGRALTSVDALALQPDGKIIIGGWFTSVDGVGRNGIARVNHDGRLDTSFDPGSGVDDRVKALTIVPSGDVLIGGYFTQVDSSTVGQFACLKGDFRPLFPSPIRLTPTANASATNARFQVVGDTGCSYTVEASENLRTWRTLTNFVSASTNTAVIDPGVSRPAGRFYRALAPW